jgi:hypothetical protein
VSIFRRHETIHFNSSFSRGSPMVIGVKCADEFATSHIPVMFSKGKYPRWLFSTDGEA